MLVGMGGVGVSVASAEEDATAVDTSAVIEPQAGQQEVEPAETASESQTKQQDEDQAERPDEEQTKQQTEPETEPNGVASEQGDAAKSNDVASEQDDADSIQSITQPDDQPIVLAAQPTALANQIQPAAESETGSRLLEETFKNSNFADPDSWSIKDGACLTAKTGGCTSTKDSTAIQGHEGNGYLQLTDNSRSAKGSVLYNQPIISKNGLHVSFDYYMYYSQRTGSGLPTPGDGIGFFLVDGAATLQQTGAAGAGLGYATNDEDGTGSTPRQEGVAQGILGIGLDRFGNFSTQHASGTTNRVTGGDDCGQWKNSTGSNSITVRGKGSMDSDRKWTKGYCIVTSKQVASGLGTKAATNAANGKRVDITIAPLANATATTQKLTVKIDGATVLEYDIDRLPDSVKFGFSASTGAAHQVQLIRGLSVYSMKQLSQLDLVKSVDKDKYPNADTHVFQVGDKVPYKFVVRNSGNTRLDKITVNDPNITVNDPNITNVTCDARTLAPGAQTQCSGTLTITESLVGENGTFTNTATATATDAHNKTITSPRAQATIHVNKPLGAPEKHKRIKKNGDGTYTLNVDVKGAASSTTVTTTQPIDFTLVLDVSGSMDKSMGSTDETKRLGALKTAVDKFLDGAANANEGAQSGSEPVRVGLVKFAGKESKDVGNDMYWSGGYQYNYSQIVSNLTTDMSGLKTMVNQLKAGGATRADYGFQYASKVMSNARPNAKKVVIFFTDGSPTSSSGFEGKVANKAVEAAKELKDGGATVYSIGVFPGADPSSTEGNANQFMHAVSSNFPKATAYNNHDDGDEDAGYYKAAKNALELNAIFNEIEKSETTTSAYTNVVMEDTLSDYVDLAYSNYKVVAKDASGKVVSLTENVDYTLTYDASTKKFTVAFLKPLVNNVTYTLEYNVKPTQKAYDEYADNLNAGQGGYGTVKGDTDTDLPGNATSSKQQGFHSNDSACLTYTADGKTHECKDNPYSHPVIQVVSSTLHIDKKWNGDGPKPENITVDIKQGNDTYKRVTLKRDDSGKWSTDVIIPAGAQKTYTVTEVEPDSHLWKASYQNKVGDGNLANSNVVTVPKSEASQNATVVITNTLKQATLKNAIGVKKELVGRDWKNSDEFTFKLKADGSNPDTPMPASCENQSACTVTVKRDSSDDHVAYFGDITYNAGKAEYTYLVTENAGNASAMYYSQAEYRVVVSVMKDETSGEWKAVVESVTQLKTDYGAAGSNWDSTRPMLFTNKYISASSLPLTGRMGAERWWQIAAGGVGVLALLAVVAADQWRRKKRLG